MVRQGRSFSGHERHCAFLNQRGKGFVSVSALSGFDFEDDGRGLGLTDWDRDGDLDVWLSNRNGPQVRFLENERSAGTSGNYLALRLLGTKCNRDAIGARVVVVDESGGGSHQRRTLRAGGGFLSQSSKWLHFGLGESDRPVEISVRWPDGTRSSFQGVAPNRRYLLVQGEDPVEAVSSEVETGERESTAQAGAAGRRHGVSAVFLSSRVPLPPVLYRDGAGKSRRAADPSANQPTLIVLWASWCPSCREELAALADARAQLAAVGIQVVALAVDHLAHDAGPSSAADALALAREWKLPFAVGSALESVPVVFDAVMRHVFDRHTPFQVPVSFLVDRAGEVAAIHRGSVGLGRLLEDADKLDLAGESRRAASVPFPGKWVAPLRHLHPVDVALHLVAEGASDDVSLAYYSEHARLLAGHVRSPELLVQLGAALERKQRDRDALEFYRGAMEHRSASREASSRYAVLLATTPDPALRDVTAAHAVAQAAVERSRRSSPEALFALSVTEGEQGFFFSAGQAAEEALGLISGADGGTDGLEDVLRACLKNYTAKKVFRTAHGLSW